MTQNKDLTAKCYFPQCALMLKIHKYVMDGEGVICWYLFYLTLFEKLSNKLAMLEGMRCLEVFDNQLNCIVISLDLDSSSNPEYLSFHLTTHKIMGPWFKMNEYPFIWFLRHFLFKLVRQLTKIEYSSKFRMHFKEK